MSDLTKDWTNCMNVSENLNVTLLFLHGMPPEEQEVFLKTSKIQLQIKDLKRVLFRDKDAHRMLLVDCAHLRETKSHREADALLEEIHGEEQRQEQLKNNLIALELRRDKQSLGAVQTSNPKIYNLKKKLIELKELCHKRKRDFDKIERERKNLASDYIEIVNKIKSEEGIRSVIAGLEAEVKEKDTVITDLKDEYSRLDSELKEYENDLQERKYASKLLDSYQYLSGAVSEVKKEVSALNNQFKDLEIELQIKKKTPAQSNSEDVRLEIKRLEQHILEMDKQLTEKQKIHQKIASEHKNISTKLQEAKKHAKPKPTKTIQQVAQKVRSPILIGTPNSGLASYRVCLSPKQMEMCRTPGMLSRRSKATTARRPKLTSEQQEALKTIRDVGKAGDTMQAVHTLSGYGNSAESLSSKIIKLNRALLQKSNK